MENEDRNPAHFVSMSKQKGQFTILIGVYLLGVEGKWNIDVKKESKNVENEREMNLLDFPFLNR